MDFLFFAFIIALFVWLLFQIPSGIIFTCLGVVAGFFGLMFVSWVCHEVIYSVKHELDKPETKSEIQKWL